MEELKRILDKYGLKQTQERLFEDFQERLCYMYENYEVRNKIPKKDVQNSIVNEYLSNGNFTVIADVKKFSNLIDEEGISLDVDDWKLRALCLKSVNYSSKNKIEWFVRAYDMRPFIKEEMGKQKENPELYLKHIFESEPNLEEMNRKLFEEVEIISRALDNSELTKKLQNELGDVLEKIYNEVKMVISNGE